MISLKAYNQEIEQLIDNGLYDEAIAHCIHVLLTYPKCIDSYRNLGKSLLELKKYPEALDVFSRVLSAIPDDFISHVGLSIIFEDQNNLDLAIWHMEQAFDVQPSNLTIQDELKRLFGRRDGEQPTKIRLTRGALVRMYARGELFQQAITEILSILDEDPRRIDLEVILARMHYLSGALDESEATCNRIIERIPYCFEANRILQQIHINKNDNDAAAINRNRLVSLDPYYQFLPSPFSEQEVPENKVLLEKLQYVSSKTASTQIPAWLEDIDETTIDKPSENFNWLSDLKKDEVSTSNSDINPFIVNEQTTEDQPLNKSIQAEDTLPDWLKTAGWNSNVDLEPKDELQSSNSQPFESKELTSEAQSYDQPKDIQTDFGSKVTNEDLASLFTELKEGKMENDNLASNSNEEKQFPPSDWMSQFSNSDGPVSSDSSDQDFPDWLKNFQAEEPQITQNTDDIPDWLKNLQSEVEPISLPSDDAKVEKPEENTVLEETTFDNIFSENEQSTDTSALEESQPLSSEQNDGWESIDLTRAELNESSEPVVESVSQVVDSIASVDEPVEPLIDSSQTFDEPFESINASVESIEEPMDSVAESAEPLDEFVELESTPVESNYVSSDDKIPDWVKSVLIDQQSEEQKQQPQEQEIQQVQPSSTLPQESTEQMAPIEEAVESDIEPDAGIISQQTNDELLDWLRGLKAEEEPVQQNEETINPSETAVESVLENETESFSEESTLADILFPKEEVELPVVEQELSNLPENNVEPELNSAVSDSELIIDQAHPPLSDFEPVIEQEQPSISDVQEISNELIERPSDVESVEKIQTSELHLDTVFENQDENSIDELLNNGDFDNLSNAVSQNIAQGQDFNQLLSTITATENQNENNFSYWQCLGDIYSKNNHLNDALLAYQKAEDILMKSISS